MSKEIEYEKSSGNVFHDLGFKNPKERLLKAKLAATINVIIKNKKLDQKAAALVLGIDQPKISALSNGRLSGYTIDRLFRFLYALEQDIEITITENSKPVASLTSKNENDPIRLKNKVEKRN
jgi:predicted XRE-type DNA-binding protein